ncbi:MAG TPA: YidC/Oxa1 family membrane protein insertase [Acidimicrobiales bacterium]|nr:YidC/Oxa1 family membrane protein insertase [Acidimicrobiales bacterium]
MSAVLLASTLGDIFKPLYEAMAWLIAFFYRIVPNYAFAIAMLTIVVMGITAPLTVKSTKSMTAMQRLGPELKKIQQKYKGDRTRLNEEMMKLYKEHGVNPAGGCLPMLLQFPIFIVLYGVIRGLTNTLAVNGHQVLVNGHPVAQPRYISHNTKLYHDLVASHGQMMAFGINLSEKALGHHSSVAAAIPYYGLVLFAIGLQWLQMHQLNSRNPQYAQANPQAAALQKYMPIIFGFIYITIAAGVNIYFIVSSLCRIGIQEAVFRSGVLERKPAPAEEMLPGRTGSGGKPAAPRRRTIMDRLAEAQQRALDAQKAQQLQQERRGALDAEARDVTKDRAPDKGTAGANGGKRTAPAGGAAGNGKNGSRAPGSSGGPTRAGGSTTGAGKQTAHPRAKGKRARKAR